jgi:hypothetical protein
MVDASEQRTVVLLDADTVAGWRRPAPSLAQLHRAVVDLRAQHPHVTVAVVADPSIKWALPAEEQDAFEHDIVNRNVVCAPAGTRDGTHGWVLAVADRARSDGQRVLVVTDRAIPGVPVVRLRNVEGRFAFDLESAAEVEGRPSQPYRRRRGRSGARA